MPKKELPVDEKASHREVKYERPSNHTGQSCGDCRHVIEPMGEEPRCQTVKDPIYLVGWCIRYKARKKK